MRTTFAVLLALLCAVAATADSIDRMTPTQFYVDSTEEYIELYGTGLIGAVATELVFSGPAGTFALEPSYAQIDEHGKHTLISWMPLRVLNAAGTYSLTVRATDANAVRTIGPVTFTVVQRVQEIPPLLGVPETVIGEAQNSDGGIVHYTVSAVSFTNTPPTVVCSRASGSFFPMGVTTVQCTAVDLYGTTTEQFKVFVTDQTPPVLTLPADINSPTAIVNFTATAVDNIDGVVAVSCDPPSGSVFAPGETIVVCTANDAMLNYVSKAFKVTTPGAEPPPMLLLPTDITREATGATGATVTYAVTTSPNATVLCSPASGSVFAIGTTAVNCTATGPGGTTTSGTFNVIVRDTTPPALTVPANITAEASSSAGAPVVFNAVAVDVVDGVRNVVCTPASGSIFALGVTPVTCSASDTRGNTSNGGFLVTVRDTTAPLILAISATPSTIWPPDHKMVPVRLTVIATDSVSAVTTNIVSIMSSDSPNGTGDGNTPNDSRITGPLTAEVRAERVGNNDRIYTITIEAVDASGNRSLGSIQVKVTQQSGRNRPV